MVSLLFTLKLLGNVRTEAQAFREALASAPTPELGWDVLGTRSLSHRAWWCLLREHVAPARLGVAVFLGVLIGLSPFYGFHVVMALACAFLFRLNKLAVWLATNVSIPFLSPFFAFVSIQLGHRALEGSFMRDLEDPFAPSQLGDLFIYWMVGFPIQGVVVGGMIGWLVFHVAARRAARSNQSELSA